MSNRNTQTGQPLDLIAPGKSSRLAQIRQKTQALEQTVADAISSQQLPPQFVLLKSMIDKHLADIHAHFPMNKQQQLFKIRFGMTLAQLKQMSIVEVSRILKLKTEKMTGMKQIADLDYNGQPLNRNSPQ